MDRLPDVAPVLRAAARRHGTPFYLTDMAAVDEAADELRAAFPAPWLHQYSLKANDLPAVVASLAGQGFGANVVSAGEWHLARRAGLPDERITLEGIGKTDAVLRAAVRAAADRHPLRWVALESVEEAAVLARLARGSGARLGSGPGSDSRLDVLLRLNPDVSPETHRGLAVGRGASKFGLAPDELAAAMAAGGGLGGQLRWRGLLVHVGSQLGAIDAWRDAVRRALATLALFRGGLADFDTLDVGGGFPASSVGTAGPPPARFAAEMAILLDGIPADRRPSRLAIEPGRFLVARAGWLVACVLHVRDGRGPEGGRQVVLDAGMTELIRPALYGAMHPVVALSSRGRPVEPDGSIPGRKRAVGFTLASVEGPICEATDALGLHRLPPLRRGDLVAIRDAGAYGATLSSRYNGRPRPPQLLLEPDGRLIVARRRGTLSSLA